MYAVSRSLTELAGEPCYPDLASLPEPVGGAVLAAGPAAAEELARECVRPGMRVWMHCMLGVKPVLRNAAARITSVSLVVVRLCEEAGIAVIAGGCPLQFRGDLAHRGIRAILSLLGAYRG